MLKQKARKEEKNRLKNGDKKIVTYWFRIKKKQKNSSFKFEKNWLDLISWRMKMKRKKTKLIFKKKYFFAILAEDEKEKKLKDELLNESYKRKNIFYFIIFYFILFCCFFGVRV